MTKLTHRFLDYVVVVGNFTSINRIDKWPSAFVTLFNGAKISFNLHEFSIYSSKSHLNFLQKLVQLLKIAADKCLHVGKVDRVVFLAVGTNVLVDELSLALQDSDAFSVEPVLAFVAANVKSVRKSSIIARNHSKTQKTYCD